MRLLRAASLLLLGACGAKSGLVVPEPVPIDANVDAFVVPPDAFSFDAGPIVEVPELIVVATADNSYRFGFGDARGLRSTFGAAEATTACEIFCCSAMCSSDRDCPGVRCGPLGACEDDLGAEIYRVPEGAVTGSDFLYVLGWSDDSVTQGLLVEVRDARGETLLVSGDDAWEACATRQDFDSGSGGPSDDEVAFWLERCDREGWFTSGGSTGGPGLSVGEANDAVGGDFPPVCGAPTADAISPRARWMWFDDDRGDGRSAFTSAQSEFQIFRISTRAILAR